MSSPEAARAAVLVVDDEPVVRRLVRRVLERMECGEVLEADDGAQARSILRERPIDLVVTDVVMPELDGLGLIRWARQECPDPAWIILSGLDTFDAAVEAIQLGAFDFLAKPPQLERLRVSVRNALAHRQLLREREQLVEELERSNRALAEKVGQLERLCDVLGDQGERIQRDLERAEVIQRALLPLEPPSLGAFRVETLYRPGRHVGGDLYDVADLDGRYAVLLVADASGHGVSSAMLSVLFKHHLRTRDEATGAPLSPAVALARANAALARDVDAPGMFITAVYALLDTEEGRVTVASAGHPPVLCRRVAGGIEEGRRTGPALAVDANARYEEFGWTLERGDQLLLFTDGALGADEGPGLDRLRQLFESSGTARATLAGVANAIESAPDPEERDDATVLLLEARLGGSRFDTEIQPPASPLRVGVRPAATLSAGENASAAFLCVRGRGTWSSAEAFHAFGSEVVRLGRPLVIDLAGCEQLDSTFLGTIHELVRSATEAGLPASLQGLSASIVALFEELHMKLVLDRAHGEPLPLPESLDAITESSFSEERRRQRVLRAHETLASLSDENREEFRAVIEGLRAEIGGETGQQDERDPT